MTEADPARHLALSNEILRGLVGSTAHGAGLDGQEDRDEMGVFVEPPEFVMGLSRLDHYVFRTAAEGTRSGPDDLDLTYHSLRRFGHLCAQGAVSQFECRLCAISCDLPPASIAPTPPLADLTRGKSAAPACPRAGAWTRPPRQTRQIWPGDEAGRDPLAFRAHALQPTNRREAMPRLCRFGAS